MKPSLRPLDVTDAGSGFDGSSPDAAPPDAPRMDGAAPDATPDAIDVMPDAKPDVARDATPDATRDATPDAILDGMLDGMDAMPDAMPDPPPPPTPDPNHLRQDQLFACAPAETTYTPTRTWRLNSPQYLRTAAAVAATSNHGALDPFNKLPRCIRGAYADGTVPDDDCMRVTDLEQRRLAGARARAGPRTRARAEPRPYVRAGPGLAADGGPRYDLSRFDQAYFDRLRSRIRRVGERGIYVSVMFFERHSTYDADAEFPWAGHPMAEGNNTDGLDADLGGDGQGREVFRLPADGGSPDVLALQEALVRHTIDALNDLDNVMDEICNECQPDRADDGSWPDFQLQLEQWRGNLYGFMTAFGPNQNEVEVISNIDLDAGAVLRLSRRPVRLEPGRDDHVRYVYDAAGGARTLEVSEGGAPLVRMQFDQVVDTVVMRRSLDLILGGALNPDGPEVPTDDWRFSRVCLRVMP